MRAVVCRAFGPPEDLEFGELPAPAPGPGEVAIRVEAAGVSFADTLMIRDLHQNKHELPFAPGMEVAGRVAETGAGVEGLSPGDRAMALVYDGGHAEYAVAPAAETFPLPESVSMPVAAALGAAYLTAHAGLFWEARLQPGETLLVLGAGGGTGLAAVEVGKALGARVVAAASTAEKCALAEERGADAVVTYPAESIRERAMAETGGEGCDAVFDPVGGALFEESFRSLGWGGRHIVVGFAGGGAVPAFRANHLLVKNRAALGLALFNYRKRRPDRLRASADALLAWAAAGRIRPHIAAELPLAEAPAALRAIMDRKAAGRLVLRPQPVGSPSAPSP